MPPPTDPNLRRQLKARLLDLPPRAFELFAGDLLVFMGLRDVAVTRYVGDGGIDAYGTLEAGGSLISIPAGVQVKRHRSNVQRPDIDRFIGALVGRYAQGIFITTAGYGRQAADRAASAIPRVAMVDGDQIVALMLQHRLGVAGPAEGGLDEGYFSGFVAQAAVGQRRLRDPAAAYSVAQEPEQAPLPEDDLISLRALSHALRVDPSVLRRRIERGTLQPDQPGTSLAATGLFFRRDRIETIRRELRSGARPASGEEWRQEFLDFARSRTMTKSYKPVLLKALLRLVDRDGAAPIDALAREFRLYYEGRHRAGLVVEHGPPPLVGPQAIGDEQLRQLIVAHPLERFLIKGFLEYAPAEGLVRIAPQLWAELRAFELLDLQRLADEQLHHYYSRPR